MNAPQALATIERAEVTVPAFDNPSAFLFDAHRMQALMSFADVMSKGVITMPKHLRGKPADCLAITLQAMRWRMDPYVVAGKTYDVGGVLGYESQLVVAVLKNSGAIKGRPHYEWNGDGPGLQCRAGFIPASEDAVLWTEWLAIGAIKVKNSPLWVTNPKQQFGYLQARNWARLYAPDALLGVYTEDELSVMDVPPAERHMGAVKEVQPEKPAIPPYAPEAFEKNISAWAKLVESGKKTGEQLLAMLATKATFTDGQRAAILALKPAESAPLSAEHQEFVDAIEGGAK